jgi:tRNA(Ile)-lysidine synthase
MPLLRTFNPGLDELLAATADVAREEEAFWQEQVAGQLRGLLLPGNPVRGGGRAASTAPGGGSCALELERLKPMSPALRRRIIRAAARSIGARVNAAETAKLMALGGFGGHPGVSGRIGSRLELSNGLKVERSAHELQFSRLAEAGPKA